MPAQISTRAIKGEADDIDRVLNRAFVAYNMAGSWSRSIQRTLYPRLLQRLVFKVPDSPGGIIARVNWEQILPPGN